MHARYNFYDLDNMGTAIPERMKKLLSKFDIIIDEKSDSKSATLAQGFNKISYSGKIVEFNKALEQLYPVQDPSEIKAVNEDIHQEKEFKKDRKYYHFIKRIIINKLIEEAFITYALNEQLKDLQDNLQSYLEKKKDEHDQLKLSQYIQEISKLEDQIRQRLELMRQDTNKKISILREEASLLKREIRHLKVEREQKINNLVDKVVKDMDNFTTSSGEKIFDKISPEQKRIIAQKVAEISIDAETKKNILLNKKNFHSKEIDRLNAEKSQIVLSHMQQPKKASGKAFAVLPGFQTKATEHQLPEVREINKLIDYHKNQMNYCDVQFPQIDKEAEKRVVEEIGQKLAVKELRDQKTAGNFIKDFKSTYSENINEIYENGKEISDRIKDLKKAEATIEILEDNVKQLSEIKEFDLNSLSTLDLDKFEERKKAQIDQLDDLDALFESDELEELDDLHEIDLPKDSKRISIGGSA